MYNIFVSIILTMVFANGFLTLGARICMHCKGQSPEREENMNVVVLMGRLARDPEIRQGQGENPTVIARYTLAVDRRFTKNSNEQTADFISMVSFGKAAEFIEKYVHKGTKIVVRGRIQTGSYTNREGQKVYTTDVVGEDVEFAESKKAQDGGNYDGGQQSYQQAPAQEPQGAPQEQDTNGFGPVDDFEQLPFA